MFGMIPFDVRRDLAAEESGFDRLFNLMNRPLASFFNDTGFSGRAFSVDVKDNGTSYELKAELPGLTKDDINLTYKDSYLTIATKQESTNDEKDEAGNYIRRERYSGSMSRSFYINDIDENHCQAEFKDGILTVILPKVAIAQEDSPKQIPINTNA